MKKNLGFRAWFYFRQGWTTYFAFIFAAVNTLVTTYYLAIEKAPLLKEIFPTFTHYIVVAALVVLPTLILIGYVHYKKFAAFSSEADIVQESQPYNYKSPPGWYIEVQFPLYLALSKMMVKWSQNEKLTESEINEMIELQKKINILLKGGYVGNPPINPNKERI
ncbi:MAG: hypothetical protein ACKO7N_04010 [Candidatus Nitrosotenuis sp.]